MPAEALDGEALRGAVVAAGAGDPRVRAMLQAAEVSATAAGAPWEASHGAVQGYAVTVGLCVEDLAVLAASPATRDLLERGFARAVGLAPDRAMTALCTTWNRRGVVQVANYREVARRSAEVTLDEALRRYLSASEGTPPGGTDLRAEEGVGQVTVTARSPVDQRGRLSIEAALRAMLGPTLDVRWSAR